MDIKESFQLHNNGSYVCIHVFSSKFQSPLVIVIYVIHVVFLISGENWCKCCLFVKL